MRVAYIDAIKGYAILLMVIAHAVAWNIGDWALVMNPSEYNYTYAASGILWHLIYAFHMYLFFYISFCFFPKVDEYKSYDIFCLLRKKAQRLLLPFFFCGTIHYFYNEIFGYWFLLVLFELYVVFVLLFAVVRKRSNLPTDIAVITVFYGILLLTRKILPQEISNILEYNRVINYYPAAGFGLLISKYNLKNLIYNNEPIILTSIILFCANFIIRYMSVYHMLPFDITKTIFNLPTQILQYISAIIIVEKCFISYFRKSKPTFNIQNILCKIGVYSLSIYMFHEYFIISSSRIGQLFMGGGPASMFVTQLLIAAGLAFIAIGLSVIVHKILNQSRWLSYLFLGINK